MQSFGDVVQFGLLGFCGIFLLRLLFWYYGASEAEHPGWVRRWELASGPGPGSYWQLVLASIFGLFLEMLMIRWVSSEVRIFAYFKNFVLIACFLGFGLGCYLSRRRINVMALALPVLTLVAMIGIPGSAMATILTRVPDMLGKTSQVHIWGIPAHALGLSDVPLILEALLISIFLFLLVTFIFIPVGQFVGAALESVPEGISGYSLNVLASVAGTALFTILCFWRQPPALWLVLAGALAAPLFRRQPRLALIALAGFAVSAALLLPRRHADTRVIWSPYQKLTLKAIPNATAPELYELLTNSSWYQQILDLSPQFVRSHPQKFVETPIEWNAYNVPYHFYGAPRSVLVLGSGMGNDVAAALRNTKAAITAVEIDPAILALGRELHFEKPYQSPRVRVIVNDARNYIQTTSDRYDLVLFSLLDSHTTASHYSNIRIDNYVYTVEAMQAARRMLNPDGIMMVKFEARTPWIAGRIRSLLHTVFEQEPVSIYAAGTYQTGGLMFAVGSRERLTQALKDPELATRVQQTDFPMEAASLTTDDWPYFYQHEPGLPLNVILLSLMLFLICTALISRTTQGVSHVHWHFFFLGAGFMLLETQIISKMALLFGTTWLVNSIAISGLMLLIVLANLTVQWRGRIPYRVAYGGLFAMLAIAWLVPLRALFFHSVLLKGGAAVLLLCLPVFFAGLIFIRSFAQVQFSAKALGSNLFGAVVGGLLESLSFWIGLKWLLLVAAALYAASAITLRAKAAQPTTAAAALAGVGK